MMHYGISLKASFNMMIYSMSIPTCMDSHGFFMENIKKLIINKLYDTSLRL